ncbi:heavy metal translocating P-type ATPase [Cohnella cholangitidis]|uniref:P-type Cu(+) transporter n=1 Tax=Cohnella cholangitidis TaxID=2598458 RepID=A0A7G5BSH5_9BACL|nr:cation-translocating P-type ATPase [Cohnella cholangitidis]QMV39909.1 cation-translocating P-type ATPase [Cohnella cholangitidis]
MQTIRLYITGMTCAACSSRIEKAVGRLEGVHRISVSLATAQASVQLNQSVVAEADIYRKIEQLGYGIEQAVRPKAANDSEIRNYRIRFLVSLILSMPLLWGMFSHLPLLSAVWVPHILHNAYFQWVIATVLQFYIGYPFYQGAYQALKQRSANMDVLVVISTSAAYFYSHYQLFRMSRSAEHVPLYFDSIAMILTVILLGKWLESIAKGKALKDLNELHDLQIRLVRVVRGREESWIPSEQLRKGDIVRVIAGEWIAADGIVVAGASEIDESLLTGESYPVMKSTRDRVYSGTRCLNGSLVIKAASDTQGSRLSRMIAMVEEAQSNKPMIARKVDRVAAYFVPFMILASISTYAAWMYSSHEHASELAMRQALSVLLVACPCALGLATPVSILIATALSAKSGILFKDGRAMEVLHRTNHVLLDKTGTLTEGKPRLIAVHSLMESESYLLRMASAVEQHSAHLLAQAIVQAAEQRRILIPDAAEVSEIPGNGMKGLVEGKAVRVGHYKWMQSERVPMSMTEQPWNLSTGSGRTILYVSIQSKMAGWLVLSDQLREEAPLVVRKLKAQADVWMLTGDQRHQANRIASEAGVEHYRAAMSPEMKLDVVRELRDQGRIVAVIGDGNNDTAALAAANVGIAMGGGVNSAREAGDVILVNDRLYGVLDAITISRRTMGNIKQNLTIAAVYNVIAVPFAALGYLDPRLACMGMAASSITVVANALRLQKLHKR